MRHVVDTNVLIAANETEAAKLALAAKAARFLASIVKEGVLLEDDRNLVFDEYRRYLHFDGQPGPGDQFFRWYNNLRWTGGHVEMISLPIGAPIIELIPSSLKNFDPSDHKWIAVYMHGDGDQIVNATDSDWEEASEALQAEGIVVTELRAT